MHRVDEGRAESINSVATPPSPVLQLIKFSIDYQSLLRAFTGRLPDSAWIYGEVFVNGVKSCMPYGSYGLLENEYTGTSSDVRQMRSISGYQALQNEYDLSSDINSKWANLLILFLMAVGYRILVFIFLQFRIRKTLSLRCLFRCNENTNNAR